MWLGLLQCARKLLALISMVLASAVIQEKQKENNSNHFLLFVYTLAEELTNCAN